MGLSHIPIIDLSDDERVIQKELATACKVHGFFYVKNHGVDPILVNDLFCQAKKFFNLSLVDKEKIHFSKGDFRRGYVPLRAENTDTTMSGDLKEAYDFTFASYDEGQNLFVDDSSALKEKIHLYNLTMSALATRLFYFFTNSLGLEDTYFVNKMNRPMTSLRLIHYPPQKIDFDKSQGIGVHTDYECLTLLAQDDVGGLQVLNLENQWVDAPPIPNTFIVNVGEMLTIWTNGLYRATPHRVINCTGVERLSIPFFFSANKDMLIEPITNSTLNHNTSFVPVIAGDYLRDRVYSVII